VRFDSESSRAANGQPTVVLPNVLWQLLRPFIPANQDFDRSFAETFAIPEFRTIGSGASKACSKMLSLLAAFRDISEETAARLLSNAILIDRLRATDNDEQFREQVESAIASENQLLLEERAAMEKQIADLRVEKERIEQELARQKQEAVTAVSEARELSQQAQELAVLKDAAELRAKDASGKLSEVAAGRCSAEDGAKHESKLRHETERSSLRMAKIAGITVACLASVVFELVIHYVLRWDWLLRHHNSYGLQGCICLTVSFAIVGLWVHPWRRYLWITGSLSLILALFQMLGGPGQVK
jgi:hypothetical protein